MELKGIIDKAKEAKEKAAEAGKEAKEKVAEAGKEAKEKVVEAGSKKAQEIIDSSLAELEALRPLMAKSGLVMGNLKLSVTIPPSLEVSIHQTVGRADALKALEEAEGNEELSTLQSLVVSTLRNAYALSSVCEKYGYTFGQMDLELSIPPTVHVHLVPYAIPNETLELPPAESPINQ